MSKVWIILARPENPLNIGSVVRLTSNFGALGVRIAGAKKFDKKKAAITAPNLEAEISKIKCFPNLEDALADIQLSFGLTARLRKFNAVVDFLPPRKAAEIAVRNSSQTHKIALVAGTEKSGLLNEELNLLNYAITIPTAQNQSLNLAQAVGIALYEFFLAFNNPKIERNPFTDPAQLASAIELQRTARFLNEFLEKIDFFKKPAAATLSVTASRILKKMKLTEQENNFVFGILKHIIRLWDLSIKPPEKFVDKGTLFLPQHDSNPTKKIEQAQSELDKSIDCDDKN